MSERHELLDAVEWKAVGGSTNKGVGACEGVCVECKVDCAESREGHCVKRKDLPAVGPHIAASRGDKIVLKVPKWEGKVVPRPTCKACGNSCCRGAVCVEISSVLVEGCG